MLWLRSPLQARLSRQKRVLCNPFDRYRFCRIYSIVK
jgi:hypothetical protein